MIMWRAVLGDIRGTFEFRLKLCLWLAEEYMEHPSEQDRGSLAERKKPALIHSFLKSYSSDTINVPKFPIMFEV